MQAVTEEQKIEKAVALFRKFITDDMNVDSLAEELDTLQTQYGCMLIDSNDVGYVTRCDMFYLLYQLKCICRLKDLSGPDE